MNTLAVDLHPQAHNIKCTDVIQLIGSRTISAPLVWFPKLSQASKEQLENRELFGDGEGVHQPDVDESLSIAGLLRSALKNKKLKLKNKTCRFPCSL